MMFLMSDFWNNNDTEYEKMEYIAKAAIVLILIIKETEGKQMQKKFLCNLNLRLFLYCLCVQCSMIIHSIIHIFKIQ